MPVHTPFDELACTYDADFTSSVIGRMQRRRVWKVLTPLLNKAAGSLKILEINCGTGEDAFQLAALGHRVIATDASDAMIGMAKNKAARLNIVSINPQFMVCPFDQLAHTFANEKFDLVFSNFGGLNCINKKGLEYLCNDLARLTGEGGKLFLVLMGRCCLWEIVYYAKKGKFRTAFRRLKSSVPFSVNGQALTIQYYSPGALKKLFDPFFSLVRKKPVGLFIPPSYLENKFASYPARLSKLEKLEEKFGHSSFSGLADHYCAVFKKISRPE